MIIYEKKVTYLKRICLKKERKGYYETEKDENERDWG